MKNKNKKNPNKIKLQLENKVLWLKICIKTWIRINVRLEDKLRKCILILGHDATCIIISLNPESTNYDLTP